MRKALSFLLCLFLTAGLISVANAQSVSCPEARLTFSVPDSWISDPLPGPDDPGLCLLLRGDGLTLSVYVDDTGGFQVFTGDDTESSVVYCAGIEMTFVSGRSGEGDYRIYTWSDLRDQVQFYFLITGSSKSSRRIIENIMDSIVRK